ncbi:hypothetical protein NDU88_006570 [Pleurodeles waltl]|uniref:Uncharacterized protein n=1 Tax=Pleurodeles waltl TaxID=8319 RepID=A0AAV7QL51_PLEWA|nr:hypothetical protein NDU88_006570 [Pleurodeles waltl]
MTTDTLPGLCGFDNAPRTPTALSLRFGVHGGIAGVPHCGCLVVERATGLPLQCRKAPLCLSRCSPPFLDAARAGKPAQMSALLIGTPMVREDLKEHSRGTGVLKVGPQEHMSTQNSAPGALAGTLSGVLIAVARVGIPQTAAEDQTGKK